jgi:hypothetical protein
METDRCMQTSCKDARSQHILGACNLANGQAK